MSLSDKVIAQAQIHKHFAVVFLSVLVGAHGLYIVAVTLLDQIATRHGAKLTPVIVDIPLLIGMSLIYLSTQLKRRKKTAWQVTVIAYSFYLGLGVASALNSSEFKHLYLMEAVRELVLPSVVLGFLWIFRREFVVQSDIQGFRYTLRFVFIVLMVAFLYGVTGFTLLDKSDFHQETSLANSVHYTIDQFDLTTVHPLHPYTTRAHLFADSLSFVSTVAVIYVVFSLFRPLRMRLLAHGGDRDRILELLNKYGGSSEEFFKIWPHDKQYFFDSTHQSALAFHVYKGVALCLSDPVGDKSKYTSLMDDFNSLCFSNDWIPALVHVDDSQRELYKKHDFTLQQLGQEAILNLDHFTNGPVKKKYFRQINNKFTKQGYTAEMLTPPHSTPVLDRLQAISTEWLTQGSRAERGFVMGYYTAEYMQKCQVMVARDATGTIQAFTNLVPATFDHDEATYDMLRNSRVGLGNINDFLLMGLITKLQEDGYKRLNLGLCPLVGLEQIDKDKRTLIDNVLKFAYANGDRFYSFNGLHRFKNKYEPEWQDRYLGYQGGIRGFTRTINALIRAMRVKA